jgi:hypothetical protein
MKLEKEMRDEFWLETGKCTGDAGHEAVPNFFKVYVGKLTFLLVLGI